MMHKIGYILLRALIWIPAHLPLLFHHGAAHFLCWLLRDVFHYRRDVVMTNLSRSFPDKKYKELTEIADRFYLHLADIIVEGIWYGGCTNPKRFVRNCPEEMVNPEVIQDLMDKSPAVMILNSHCGNWELYGGIESYNYTDKPLPFNEQNFCVVYRELSSRAWDEVMRDNRFAPLKDRKHFPGYIETKDLIRYAYSHRDEKKIYNVNTDQRPYFESPANMDVDFFGQQVQTMTGAAALARKLGMSVAYLSMRRERRGHYVMRYEPICEDASKLGVAEIMQQYYRLVEADIRQQPENYLWTHQRFART